MSWSESTGRTMAGPAPRRRALGAALAVAGALALGACGFHLRGEAAYPFSTLYIEGGGGAPLAKELERSLRAGGRVRIAASPQQADAVLVLMTNESEKIILSLSGGGRVVEYLLTQRVVFRVSDKDSAEWLPASEVSLRRDFSYNDSTKLAKEHEERMLFQDMQSEAVAQILRRLAAAKRPA